MIIIKMQMIMKAAIVVYSILFYFMYFKNSFETIICNKKAGF